MNKIRDDETITIRWHVNDVLQQDPSLTREKAMNILRAVKDEHDANVGINWDVIEEMISRKASKD